MISQYIQDAFYVLSILGMAFLVIKAIFNPQQRSHEAEQQLAQRLNQLNLDFVNLRDNHVHTLDVKLGATNESVQKLALELTRLNTILEERLPKRK